MIAGEDVAERVTLVRGDVADREALAGVVQEHGVGRPAPPTALVNGVRRTLEEFARLHEAGRLDARELG